MKDMPFHRILNLKRLAAVVAGLFFIENVCLVHLAQASLWEERRQALKARDQAEDVYTKATPTAATLLAALPKVEPGMVLPLSQKAISDLHINKDIAPDQKVAQAARLIPDWLQMAIAPYATIQAVDLSKDPKAKTVLLIQDAHLHQEAQTNIAGAIESLGRAVESQNGPLLVGLEGAEKEEIDLAAYFAYPHRKALRETAFALMKANVLKGSEVAAIGYKGQEVLEGPVPSPFVYTAVEKQAEYDANVKAFLASVPIKERAQAALKALGRSLVELRNKYYTPELIRFDEKLAGFEKGDLGISDYVVYLDNLQPAASPNLRELVTAALIEKSMDFHRVEEQRTRMLSALVRNIKESDIQKLLQVSTLFRAGHVSYARYYDYLTGLCRNNGVSLAQYPDMNLYVQYVLKSEKIDQNQLFAELREHEEKVQGRLMTTKEQSAIASLIRDNHLLNKLSQHILTEDEWKVYENRREEIGKIRDRLAQLGQPYPPALAKMDESWRTFEDFYRWALARNKTMSAHLASRLESMPIRYAVMVSGGFHTQGLVQHFKEKDLNVLTISPKITKVEDGPSSLDILASGQKPLDQLFVGERLFLDLPPILAADPEQARDLILAGAAARSGAANQPQTRGEFSAKRTPDGDVVVQRSLPKRLASKVASLLKGPARYVGGILMAFALIFGGSRSAEAVSPQAVPAPVAAVAHLPLAQVPPTQQIAQPPTEVERKDAGASPEAPAPLKFELNEWYSGGKQYEKEGRNWYGRWANVSADQSDEILGNKFLRLTIKPSNPNDLRELFGFAIEVKGLTEEGRIKGGVFLLSATRNDSRSQWQVSSEFGPGAEVTVDPDNGTVSVTIPVAGVRSALQKEGVVRIGQVHVQTGQQNGPKLNFKTIECRVLANAASRPQDVDETFPQISVMRSGWFRTLLYGPIAVVIAALLFFLGRHLRGRSRASRGQPLLSLLLPLAAVVLFGGAASPTVGWEGMSGIDRMFAFFGFLVIILIPMFITVVSGFYLANEWLSRDRMFKSDYDAKRWHRRAAAFLFIWFLGITVYLFSLILHWANMERKSAAPANPSDKVSTTERDKSSKPSSSTLEPPSKTGLLKIKENGGKKLLSFFLPLAAVVLFGGAAAPGQTGNRGILGVLAVTSLLAMTYARKSGRQGIGAGDFSTLSPEDKLEMLTRLQAEGAVVNMTWNNYGRPGEKASQIRSITGQESGPELVVVWLEGYEFGILVKNIQSLVVQQASALGEGTRRDAGELAGQVHSEEESGEGIEDQVVLVSRVDFGFIYDQLGRVGPLFVGMENSDPTFAGCLSQFNSIFSKFRRILGEGSWQWERVPKELLRNVRQLMVQTRSLGVTGSAAAVVSESTKNVIDCINRILGKEQDRESKGRTGGGKALLSLLLSLAAVVLFGGAAAPERTSGALGVLSGLAAQFILLGSLLFLPKKSRSSGPVTLGFGPIIPTILESIVGGGMTWVAMAIFTFAGMDPVTALVVTAVAAALSYAVVQGAVTVGPKGQRVEMGFSRFFQIFVARFMTMLPTFAGMAAIFFVGAPWYWALVGIGLTIVVTTGYNALVMEDRWWGKVKGEVSSCSFSSDGKTLAMVMKDGATRLYDVDRDDKGQITSLTPVALTRMLETLDEYRAREGTGGLAPVEEVKISGEVRSLALSPDGRRLAMAGEDGVVRIFVRDESGRFSAVEEMMFSGEAERLLSLSSDGRTLTVEGKDGRVHIYNIEGGTGGLAPVEEKKGVGDVTLWQNVKALIRRLPGSRRFLVSVLTPFITTLVLLGSQTLSLAQDNVNLEYAPLLSQGGLGSITVFLPFPIMLALFIAYFYLLRICLKSLDKKNVRDPQVGRAGAIHLGMACLALLAWVFSMAFNIEFNFSTYFVLFTLLILAVFEGGVFIFGFFSRQNPYFIAEEDHLSGYELEPFKNWVIENRDKRVFDRGGIHLQMPLSLELIKSYIHIYGLDNPLPSDVRKVMTRHNLNKWEQEVVELLYQWWEKTYLGRKKIVVGDDQAGIQIELIVDKRAVPAIEALTSETPPDTETLTGWLRQWLSGQRPTLLGQPLSLFKTEDRLHHWFDVVEQFNGLGLTPQERESVVAELLDAIADFPRLSMSSLSTVTSNAPFRFLDDQSAVDFALYIFTRLLVAWYRESNANRGGSASEHIIRDALYLDLVDKIFVLLIKGLDEIPGIDSSKVIEEFLFSLAEENPRLKGDIAALLERFPQLKSNAQSLSELADEISADEDSDGLENQGPDDDALGREPVEILVGWDRDSYEIEYERTPPSLNWQFIVWLYHIVSSSLTTVTHRLFHWSKRPKTTALSLFLPLAAVVLFGGASGFSWPALISLVGFFVTIALVAKNRRSIGNFFASLVPKALRKGSAPEFAVQSDVEKSTMRRLLLFTAISAGFLVLVAPAPVAFAGVVALIGGYLGIRYPSGSVRMLSFITRKNPKAEPKMGQQAPSTSPEKPGSAPAASQPASERPAKVAFTRFGFYLDLLRDYLKAPAGHLTRVFRHSGRGGPYSRMALLLAVAARAAEPDGIEFLNQFLDEVFRGYDPKKGEFKRSNLVIEILSGDLTDFETVCSKADEAFGMSEPSQQVPRDNFRRFAIMLLIMRNRSDVGRMQKLPDIKQIQLKDMPPRQFDLWFVLNNVLFNLEPSPADSRQKTV
ncbi:MAG: WD40 repeat domain-containing protein, partial [Elusimicrobia bacterium]|nr:WD40 repeat domain-containing protein [Candidatus Obscuribacterium magneticum]